MQKLLIVGAGGAIGTEITNYLFDNQVAREKFSKIYLLDQRNDFELSNEQNFECLPQPVDTLTNIHEFDHIIDVSGCNSPGASFETSVNDVLKTERIIRRIAQNPACRYVMLLHSARSETSFGDVIRWKEELVQRSNIGNVSIKMVHSPFILTPYASPSSFGAIVVRIIDALSRNRNYIEVDSEETINTKWIDPKSVVEILLERIERKSRVVEHIIHSHICAIEDILTITLRQFNYLGPFFLFQPKLDEIKFEIEDIQYDHWKAPLIATIKHIVEVLHG